MYIVLKWVEGRNKLSEEFNFVFTLQEHLDLFNCNYEVDVVKVPFNTSGLCCENVVTSKFYSFRDRN